MSYVLVFLGGGFGCVSRYAISLFITRFYQNHLPLATFFSNVISCVVLALVLMMMDKTETHNRFLQAAVMVGFCGGFSTFSTFSFETVQLLKNGYLLTAMGNVLLSVGICLLLLYKLAK